MSWSPTSLRHTSSSRSSTRSWKTSRVFETGSRTTAPMPATPCSQDPSVNTKTFPSWMQQGIVRGGLAIRAVFRSLHHLNKDPLDFSGKSTSWKIWKQKNFSPRPKKKLEAKFNNPCSSWASCNVRVPRLVMHSNLSCSFSIRLSLFLKVNSFSSNFVKSRVAPRTSKENWNGWPFWPVRLWSHPNKVKKSEHTWSTSSAISSGQKSTKSSK